jgi:hypothetical protein
MAPLRQQHKEYQSQDGHQSNSEHIATPFLDRPANYSMVMSSDPVTLTPTLSLV